MSKYNILDCMEVVGSSPETFDDEKVYVSTGAVNINKIDYSQTELVAYNNRPSRANLVAQIEDILFAKMFGTKKVLMLDKTTSHNIYSTGFFAVRANEKIITPKCLYYLISSESFLEQKDKNCSGATQKAITNTGLKKIFVNIPNLEEQEKITKKFDVIDKLISMRQQQLLKLDELVKSQFIEMFGDPNINPYHWNILQLGKCIKSIDNGKSFVCNNNPRIGNAPAILKLSAVTYGVYKPEENKAIIDSDDFVKSAEVQNEDLLFTRKNTPDLVGMSSYVFSTPEKLMMPDLIFRINTKEICNKVFLWQFINHDSFRKHIQNIATGSAKSMSNISKERLMKLQIALPPIELQNKFANFVKQVDKSKLAIEKNIEKLEILKKSLMQKYFG